MIGRCPPACFNGRTRNLTPVRSRNRSRWSRWLFLKRSRRCRKPRRPEDGEVEGQHLTDVPGGRIEHRLGAECRAAGRTLSPGSPRKARDESLSPVIERPVLLTADVDARSGRCSCVGISTRVPPGRRLSMTGLTPHARTSRSPTMRTVQRAGRQCRSRPLARREGEQTCGSKRQRDDRTAPAGKVRSMNSAAGRPLSAPSATRKRLESRRDGRGQQMAGGSSSPAPVPTATSQPTPLSLARTNAPTRGQSSCPGRPIHPMPAAAPAATAIAATTRYLTGNLNEPKSGTWSRKTG